MRLMIVLLCLIWSAPASAEEALPKAEAEPPIVEGEGIALDGDTVVVEGQRLRLWGIASPDMSDPRGSISRAALDEFLRRGPLRCVLVDKVDSQRPVARCSVPGAAGPEDLGELQLSGGNAFVRRLYTLSEDWAGRYDRAEELAIKSGAGFWANAAAVNGHKSLWAWIRDFQPLTAGVLAVLAAAWGQRERSGKVRSTPLAPRDASTDRG